MNLAHYFAAFNVFLTSAIFAWNCVKSFLFCKNQLMMPSIILGYLFFFGVILVYHRHLCHCAYRINRFPRFFLLFLTSMALQGPPRWWATTHLIHHKTCDKMEDPHSPLRGKTYSFLLWLVDKRNYDINWDFKNSYITIYKRTQNIEYDWLEIYYMHTVSTVAFILYYSFGTTPLIVWFSGSCIGRINVSLVNTFCHEAGKKEDGNCKATNNVYMWPILLGANWHKNHHDQPNLVNLQKKWYQVDVHFLVYTIFRCFGICRSKKDR